MTDAEIIATYRTLKAEGCTNAEAARRIGMDSKTLRRRIDPAFAAHERARKRKGRVDTSYWAAPVAAIPAVPDHVIAWRTEAGALVSLPRLSWMEGR